MSRSYVLYGSVRYNGPWAVDQNLAHAIAARHATLYVDPPITPVTPFRFGLRSATGRQLADVVDRRVRRFGRVNVFTPVALPPLTHPRMKRLSRPVVLAQIRHAARSAEMEAPVVVGCRSLDGLVGVVGESFRVGVVMDNIAAGAGLLARDRHELEREVTASCAAADLMIAPCAPQQDLIRARGYAAELLPWGYADDLNSAYDTAVEPAEYAQMPRPLLGYLGSIDDRLDYELIVALAGRFPEGRIVFVGPLSPRLSAAARTALASRPNIVLLGTRPRTELPAYIRYLDCLLLPYADMEFTRYQSPMKLWDYMYAGPPIVGTGCAELRRYSPPILHFAEDPANAPELVAGVLASGAAGSGERRAFALANTWDARAVQLDEMVERAMAGRLAHADPPPAVAAASA